MVLIIAKCQWITKKLLNEKKGGGGGEGGGGDLETCFNRSERVSTGLNVFQQV